MTEKHLCGGLICLRILHNAVDEDVFKLGTI